MSNHFPLHDETSAPEPARDTLALVRADFGMIPNLERVMASAPALLKAYASAWALYESVSLTPAERQVVYMTANVENHCAYCVAWHSLLAERAGLSADAIERLRQGADLTDARLAALQRFTRAMIHTRGNPLRADLDAFLHAGFEPHQALEVVLGLAIKTMSNSTNGLTGTPLDRAVQPRAWTRPGLRDAAD